LLGETVEDQVEVEFAGDGDVEKGHGVLDSGCAADYRDPSTASLLGFTDQ